LWTKENKFKKEEGNNFSRINLGRGINLDNILVIGGLTSAGPTGSG